MKYSLLTLACLMVLVGYGCSVPTNEAETPLTYKISDPDITMDMSTVLFSDLYTVQGLENMALECSPDYELADPNRPAEVYTAFENIEGSTYAFTHNGDVQGSTAYVVTVLPNTLGYTDLDEFKADFDACYAGGQRYPERVTENWIMFHSSCGTGYADGSGRPVGCTEAKNHVYDSLELN